MKRKIKVGQKLMHDWAGTTYEEASDNNNEYGYLARRINTAISRAVAAERRRIVKALEKEREATHPNERRHPAFVIDDCIDIVKGKT